MNPKISDSKTILEKLLSDSEAITTRQEGTQEDVELGIKKMNAKTLNSNIARDSQNRSKIASRLTWTFIGLIACIIILAPIYNSTIGKDSKLDINSLLESFNSVFGPVLGFVLGYYFKDRDNGKSNG